MIKYFLKLFAAICILVPAYPQNGNFQPSPDAVKDSMFVRFNRIRDYTVKVKISVDMTGLRMPRKRIKLFYKAPDKIKVEADGFAIVPKWGLGGSPAWFIDMLDTVFVSGQENIKGEAQWVLKGQVNPDSLKLPLGKGDDLPRILMTVWIAQENWIVTRIETEIDSQKVFSVETIHQEIDGLYLPEKTTLEIGFKGIEHWSLRDPMGGPTSDRKDLMEAVHGGSEESGKNFNGTIIMEFYKYKLNKGLKDKIFEKSDF
ncbi:MAG: hypothetical protein V3S48_07360 [Candidatus Neomarinimicrobiota bacterium]